MYLHQKIIRIYADIVQNHTLPGVFPNFWRAVYIQIKNLIKVIMSENILTAHHTTQPYVYI